MFHIACRESIKQKRTCPAKTVLSSCVGAVSKIPDGIAKLTVYFLGRSTALLPAVRDCCISFTKSVFSVTDRLESNAGPERCLLSYVLTGFLR